jgi:hypothetical protein
MAEGIRDGEDGGVGTALAVDRGLWCRPASIPHQRQSLYADSDAVACGRCD